MKFTRIIILALFCILVFVNGIIWFSWSSMEKTFLNQDYYAHVISNSELIPIIHDRFQLELPNLLAEKLPESVLLEVELIIADLTEADDNQSGELLVSVLDIYSDALIQAFDSSWLRDQALDTLDDFFLRLDRNNGELDFSIELTPNLLALRQYFADALATELQLNYEQSDEKIEIIVDSILNASAIPESYNLADAIFIAGIVDEVDEFVLALSSFRRIINYWPYAIYVLIILLTIGLIGTIRALVLLGVVTLLLSFFLWAFVLFGRLFFVGLEFLREKVFFDSVSSSLVEIIEYAGLHLISLIAPLLYLPFSVGFLILLAGIVLKLRVSHKV